MSEFRFPPHPLTQPGHPCCSNCREGRTSCEKGDVGRNEVNPREWESVGYVNVLSNEARQDARRIRLGTISQSKSIMSREGVDSRGGILVHLATRQAFRRIHLPSLVTTASELPYPPASVARSPEVRLPGFSPRSEGARPFSAPTKTEQVPAGCKGLLQPLDPDFRLRKTGREQYPWRCFAKIIIKSAGSFDNVGSGVFVGPKHILTAAHNIWDCFNGSCGLTGTSWEAHFPYHVRNATWLWIHPNWHAGDTQNVNLDYGVIILDEPDNYSPGCLSMYAPSSKEIAGPNVYGFPSDLLACKDSPFPEDGCEPWGKCGDNLYVGTMNIAISQVKKYRFGGHVNTQMGQSGGPYLIWSLGKRVVIGVHSQGNGQFGLAKRLHSDSIFNIVNLAIKPHPHKFWGTSCG